MIFYIINKLILGIIISNLLVSISDGNFPLIPDVNYLVIPENEYERLIEENKQLKIEINKIYQKERELREIIRNNELTIEELRKENRLLKEELDKLKEKIESQDIIIKLQDDKIKSQDDKIKSQDEKIKSLNEEVYDLISENKMNKIYKFIDKLITALQDINNLNNLYYLEPQIPDLKNLRKDRIENNHYIDYESKNLIKNIYINILIDKIENANKESLEIFNDLYPNLLNNIKPFLIKSNLDNELNDSNLKSEIDLITKRANYWWQK